MEETSTGGSAQIQETTTLATSLRAVQYLAYGGVILYFGRQLFIPLGFAILISFVLYPACAWLERRGVGRMTAIGINVGLLVALVLLVTALLASQLVRFIQEWPTLQPKLIGAFQNAVGSLANFFGISAEHQGQWMSKATDPAVTRFLNLAGDAISASAFSAVMAILIPVYAVLILYYRSLWVRILLRILPDTTEVSVREMLSLTIQAYYNFIKGMGIVYVIVGLLNSLGLYFLGVPHAILFGLIASALTFIPYVGIMVGSLLPMTLAWATHDSGWYALGVVGVFAFVQYLEANVIFPLAVSTRLKVNTLAVLISIFAGSIVWGVAGMILFVPLVGILKLIADHSKSMKTVSMLLGTDNG
jgi:predicted PurR-regulated permease PerM